MSRARDDRRRNMRQQFALTREDGSMVGEFWLTQADGCQFRFTEFGEPLSADFSETHEPGSHELDSQRFAHTKP